MKQPFLTPQTAAERLWAAADLILAKPEGVHVRWSLQVEYAYERSALDRAAEANQPTPMKVGYSSGEEESCPKPTS